MKKTITFLALIVLLISITAMSSLEKKFTEEQFFEKINTETFTEVEINELIKKTDFTTFDSSTIRKCDGTSADNCKVQPEIQPIGGPLKCCYTVPVNH